MAISLSFLFRARHLWQRHPGHNRVWLWTILVLVIFQIIYSIFEVCISESFLVPPTSTWITWSCGVPLVIGFNEAVKRYEIKGEVRYQKRQRLEFGTKLGINSPFWNVILIGISLGHIYSSYTYNRPRCIIIYRNKCVYVCLLLQFFFKLPLFILDFFKMIITE